MPEVETDLLTSEQTPDPAFPSTPVSTATSTLTPQRFDVFEIIPSDRCNTPIDKEVFTTAWKNDEELRFAYYPLIAPNGNEISQASKLQWGSYNIETRAEIPDTSFINFDNTFWEKNDLEGNALNPELAGYFSPSGNYVIYRIFLGKAFEPIAKNEIWVAETKGSQRWEISEFNGNAFNIWSKKSRYLVIKRS